METEKVKNQVDDYSKLSSEEMGCLKDMLKELGLHYAKNESFEKEDLQ